jgi:hypothetical protein
VTNISSREAGIDVVGEVRAGRPLLLLLLLLLLLPPPTRRRRRKKRCDHACYPIRVVATEVGKRAQCLGCKEFGPEGEDTQAARRALLLSA